MALVSHRGVITTYDITSTKIHRTVNHALVEYPPASSAATLRWFLTDIVRDTNLLKNMFFSSHSTGWHLALDEVRGHKVELSMDDIADTLRECGVKLNTIFFDACCCANIEILHRMRHIAKYVVAFETFCPWEGLIAYDNMLSPDPKSIARMHLQRFEGREMRPDEQASDVAVLSTERAASVYTALMDLVASDKSDFIDVFSNPEYPYHEESETMRQYDVVALLDHISATDPRRAQRARALRALILGEVIQFYAKSKTHQLKTYGLSMFQDRIKILPDKGSKFLF